MTKTNKQTKLLHTAAMLRISKWNAASTWDIFQPAAPANTKRLSTTTLHTAYIYHIVGYKKSEQFEAILNQTLILKSVWNFFSIFTMKTFWGIDIAIKSWIFITSWYSVQLNFSNSCSAWLPFVVELIYACYQTYLQTF